MAFRDIQTRLAAAQALSASGGTDNYYDQKVDADLGSGEPMAVVYTITTAADGTTGNETYDFAVQTDDNTSFSSATELVSRAVPFASLTVGAKVVLALPPDAERYIRGYVTLGGTTPSVSFTCDLVPYSFVREITDYKANYTIS